MKHKEVFARASEKAYRYPYNGQINTEQLWQLDRSELNKIYIKLQRQHEAFAVEGLEKKENPEEKEIQCKMQVVKYVYDFKVAQEEARRNRVELSRERQEVLNALAAKQRGELTEMSLEELQRRAEQLGAQINGE